MASDTSFWNPDKTQIAIERIKEFCPDVGYYLAFSGGKDSVVVKKLADMAGVPYDAHFNLTTVDPPEVIRFVKRHHPDVALDRPPETMWKLIVRKRMPPTRRVRYCCEVLKERGGIGRAVLTGIRWEESSMRSKRKMVESCYKHPGKVYVNPIIDWDEGDVWNFIEDRALPYCELYDQGFKRIGCVGCPMSRTQRIMELDRWPGFRKAYLRAFGEMLVARQEAGLNTVRWNTPEDVMTWWLSENKVTYSSEQLDFLSAFE